MANRPAKPANACWLTQYLTVRDPDKALDFYARAFGFEKKFSMPGPDGKTAHAEMICTGGAQFMFGPECTKDGKTMKAPATLGITPPFGLYLYCDDVDKMYARAVAAGAKSDREPVDMFWGDRVCSVIDPDGHHWSFGTNVADFDPSKVPNCTH